MKNSMIVGRLHVSFDRGTKTNQAPDLGLDERPVETADGGLVRGLGTHFRDEGARDTAKRLGKEEGRVREAFRRRFLSSPIPGIYILPESGAGNALLGSLGIDPGVSALVAEYELSLSNEMPPIVIMEWADRVKRQLLDVPLGKASDQGAEGLATLKGLADCPALDESTRDELKKLIAITKLGAISRVELKREIEFVEIKLAAPLTPRRAVKVAEKLDVSGKVLKPRRGRRSKKTDEEAA